MVSLYQSPHTDLLSHADARLQINGLPIARSVICDDVIREREEVSNGERQLIQQAHPMRLRQQQERSHFSSLTSSGGGVNQTYAPVPLAARSILSKLTAQSLLPRAKEVGMVVDSLVVVDDGTCKVRRRDNASGGSSMEVFTSSNCRATVSRSSPQSSHLSSRRSLREMVFDSTKFATIITGIGGTGKTIVAAMVASRNDIQEAFCDGVVWLRLGQRSYVGGGGASGSNTLTYQEYKDHLSKICHQLNMAPPRFDDPVLLSSDDTCMRSEKMLHAIRDAKQDVTNLFHKMAILIVLDDLWHPSDLEWFQFANHPNSRLRLLVTSRVRVSQAHRQGWQRNDFDRNETRRFSVDTDEENMNCEWISQEVMINIGNLQEEEAVRLLLTEVSPFQFRRRGRISTCPNQCYSEDERRHAITIVRSCHYLPIAIHSIGCLFSTMSSMSGGFHISEMRDLKWLASKMSDNDSTFSYFSINNTRQSRDKSRDFYNVFDRSFSSQLHGDAISVSLKICYATFAVTFSRPDHIRPWIPIAAIELLWDGIMTEAERLALNYDKNKTKTVKILEQMEVLGLLDSKVSTIAGEKTGQIINYRVHHNIMVQYARQVFEDQNCTLRSTNIFRRLQHNSLFTEISMMSSFSWGMQRRASQMCGDVACVSRQLDMLVFWGYKKRREKNIEMPWKTAINDDGYVYRFLPLHMIRVGGKRMLIETFRLLQDAGFIAARVESMGAVDSTKAHITNVEMIMDLRGLETKKDFQYGEANFSLGFLDSEVLLTYDKIRGFLKRTLTTSESLSQQKSGLTWSRESTGEAFVSIGVSLQKQNLWIHALDVFADALEMFKSSGLDNNHPIVKRAYLHANASALRKAILVTCDSPLCVRLKYADRLRGFSDAESGTKDIEGIQLELDSHPRESSICLSPHVDLLGPDHNTILSTFRCPTVDDYVFLCPLSYVDLALKEKSPRPFGCYKFVVNEDATMSPLENPDLAVGIGLPPLVLVSRNSPNRFILRFGDELRGSQSTKVEHISSNEEGFPLELISHPGQAIMTQIESALNVSEARVKMMGIGPSKDAIQVSYNGKVIARCSDGAIFALQGYQYEVGVPVILFRGNSRKLSRWKGGVIDFVINKEGSISPKHAPNFAIGGALLGNANNVITEEEKLSAEEQCRLRPEPVIKNQTTRRLRLRLGLATKFRVSYGRTKKISNRLEKKH